MTLLALQNALRWGSQCLLWVKRRLSNVWQALPLCLRFQTYSYIAAARYVTKRRLCDVLRMALLSHIPRLPTILDAEVRLCWIT